MKTRVYEIKEKFYCENCKLLKDVEEKCVTDYHRYVTRLHKGDRYCTQCGHTIDWSQTIHIPMEG